MAAQVDMNHPPNGDGDELVSLRTAATMAGVPITTFREWWNNGIPAGGGPRQPLPIRARRLGGKVELVKADVQAWIVDVMTPR